jgi:hypothetical protein
MIILQIIGTVYYFEEGLFIFYCDLLYFWSIVRRDFDDILETQRNSGPALRSLFDLPTDTVVLNPIGRLCVTLRYLPGGLKAKTTPTGNYIESLQNISYI